VAGTGARFFELEVSLAWLAPFILLAARPHIQQALRRCLFIDSAQTSCDNRMLTQRFSVSTRSGGTAGGQKTPARFVVGVGNMISQQSAFLPGDLTKRAWHSSRIRKPWIIH